MYILGAMACSMGAFAQGQFPDIPENLQPGTLFDDMQETPEVLQKEEDLGIDEIPLHKPQKKEGPEKTVFVRKFSFSGNTVYPEEKLNKLLKDFENKDLTFFDLEEAAYVISKFYRDHGYFVAKAYLPAQDIQNGTVEMKVVEGRFGEIEVHGGDIGITDLAKSAISNHLKPDQIVKREDLEAGLLNIKDLNGVTASSSITSGKRPGTSKLNVKVEKERLVSGNIGADNWGTRYITPFRGNGQVFINNPLGFGDRINGYLISSGKRLNYFDGGYSFPVFNGPRLGLDYSQMRYKLGKELESLDVKGEISDFSTYITHKFINTLSTKLIATLNYDNRRIKSKLLGLTQYDRVMNVVDFEMTFEHRDKLWGGGFTSLRLTPTVGNANLSKSVEDVKDDERTTRFAGRYFKLRYEASRLQKVSDRFSLYLFGRGQYAGKNLEPSEKMSIGGPLGVRAYPIGEASSTKGNVFSLEGRYTLPIGGTGVYYQLVGFYDLGTATLFAKPYEGFRNGNPNLKNSFTLQGAGIGLNVFRLSRYTFSAKYAWKIGKNEGADINGFDSSGKNHPGMFWVQLGIQF